MERLFTFLLAGTLLLQSIMKKFFLVLLLILPLIFSSCNKEMECSPSLPYLAAKIEWPLSSVIVGIDSYFTYSIFNIADELNSCGTIVANESHLLLKVLFRPDDQSSFEVMSIDTIPIPAINAGDSWAGNYKFLPLAAGQYLPTLEKDIFNEVIERNE